MWLATRSLLLLLLLLFPLSLRLEHARAQDNTDGHTVIAPSELNGLALPCESRDGSKPTASPCLCFFDENHFSQVDPMAPNVGDIAPTCGEDAPYCYSWRAPTLATSASDLAPVQVSADEKMIRVGVCTAIADQSFAATGSCTTTKRCVRTARHGEDDNYTPGDRCYIKVFNAGHISVIQDQIPRTATGGEDEVFVWYKGHQVNENENGIKHMYKSFPSPLNINKRLTELADFAPGDGFFAEPLSKAFAVSDYGINQAYLFMFDSSSNTVLRGADNGFEMCIIDSCEDQMGTVFNTPTDADQHGRCMCGQTTCTSETGMACYASESRLPPVGYGGWSIMDPKYSTRAGSCSTAVGHALKVVHNVDSGACKVDQQGMCLTVEAFSVPLDRHIECEIASFNAGSLFFSKISLGSRLDDTTTDMGTSLTDSGAAAAMGPAGETGQIHYCPLGAKIDTDCPKKTPDHWTNKTALRLPPGGTFLVQFQPLSKNSVQACNVPMCKNSDGTALNLDSHACICGDVICDETSGFACYIFTDPFTSAEQVSLHDDFPKNSEKYNRGVCKPKAEGLLAVVIEGACVVDPSTECIASPGYADGGYTNTEETAECLVGFTKTVKINVNQGEGEKAFNMNGGQGTLHLVERGIAASADETTMEFSYAANEFKGTASASSTVDRGVSMKARLKCNDPCEVGPTFSVCLTPTCAVSDGSVANNRSCTCASGGLHETLCSPETGLVCYTYTNWFAEISAASLGEAKYMLSTEPLENRRRSACDTNERNIVRKVAGGPDCRVSSDHKCMTLKHTTVDPVTDPQGVVDECIFSVHDSEGPLTLSVNTFELGGKDSQLQAVSAHSRKWKNNINENYRQVDTFQNSNANVDHDWKDHKYFNLDGYPLEANSEVYIELRRQPLESITTDLTLCPVPQCRNTDGSALNAGVESCGCGTSICSKHTGMACYMYDARYDGDANSIPALTPGTWIMRDGVCSKIVTATLVVAKGPCEVNSDHSCVSSPGYFSRDGAAWPQLFSDAVECVISVQTYDTLLTLSGLALEFNESASVLAHTTDPKGEGLSVEEVVYTSKTPSINPETLKLHPRGFPLRILLNGNRYDSVAAGTTTLNQQRQQRLAVCMLPKCTDTTGTSLNGVDCDCAGTACTEKTGRACYAYESTDFVQDTDNGRTHLFKQNKIVPAGPKITKGTCSPIIGEAFRVVKGDCAASGMCMGAPGWDFDSPAGSNVGFKANGVLQDCVLSVHSVGASVSANLLELPLQAGAAEAEKSILQFRKKWGVFGNGKVETDNTAVSFRKFARDLGPLHPGTSMRVQFKKDATTKLSLCALPACGSAAHLKLGEKTHACDCAGTICTPEGKGTKCAVYKNVFKVNGNFQGFEGICGRDVDAARPFSDIRMHLASGECQLDAASTCVTAPTGKGTQNYAGTAGGEECIIAFQGESSINVEKYLSANAEDLKVDVARAEKNWITTTYDGILSEPTRPQGVSVATESSMRISMKAGSYFAFKFCAVPICENTDGSVENGQSGDSCGCGGSVCSDEKGGRYCYTKTDGSGICQSKGNLGFWIDGPGCKMTSTLTGNDCFSPVTFSVSDPGALLGALQACKILPLTPSGVMFDMNWIDLAKEDFAASSAASSTQTAGDLALNLDGLNLLREGVDEATYDGDDRLYGPVADLESLVGLNCNRDKLTDAWKEWMNNDGAVAGTLNTLRHKKTYKLPALKRQPRPFPIRGLRLKEGESLMWKTLGAQSFPQDKRGFEMCRVPDCEISDGSALNDGVLRCACGDTICTNPLAAADIRHGKPGTGLACYLYYPAEETCVSCTDANGLCSQPGGEKWEGCTSTQSPTSQSGKEPHWPRVQHHSRARGFCSKDTGLRFGLVMGGGCGIDNEGCAHSPNYPLAYNRRDAPNACCEILALKSGTIEFRAAKDGTPFSLSNSEVYSPAVDGSVDGEAGTDEGKLMIRVYGKTQTVKELQEPTSWASMFHKLIEPAKNNLDQDGGGDLTPDEFQVFAGDSIRFEPGSQAFDGFRFCMFPGCPNTNGTLQGDAQCKCGESVCEPGQYCYRPDFYQQGECSDTTGNRVIAVGDCETDQHCVWNKGWPTTSFVQGAKQCKIEFLTEGELVTTVMGWRMPYQRRSEEFTWVQEVQGIHGVTQQGDEMTEILVEHGQPDFRVVDAQGTTVYSSIAWNGEPKVDLTSKYPITKQNGPRGVLMSIHSKIVFEPAPNDQANNKLVPQFEEKYGAYGFKLCFGTCEFIDQKSKNPSPCVCGEPGTPSAVLCGGASGLYCNAKLRQCQRYPLCEDESGIIANTLECQCTAGGPYCTKDGESGRPGGSGLYCTKTETRGEVGGVTNVDGTCAVGAPCKYTEGNLKNEAKCRCGSADCTDGIDSGLFCLETQSRCTVGKPCENVDGTEENSAACTCDGTPCTLLTGLFCLGHASGGSCTNFASQSGFVAIDRGFCDAPPLEDARSKGADAVLRGYIMDATACDRGAALLRMEGLITEEIPQNPFDSAAIDNVVDESPSPSPSALLWASPGLVESNPNRRASSYLGCNVARDDGAAASASGVKRGDSNLWLQSSITQSGTTRGNITACSENRTCLCMIARQCEHRNGKRLNDKFESCICEMTACTEGTGRYCMPIAGRTLYERDTMNWTACNVSPAPSPGAGTNVDSVPDTDAGLSTAARLAEAVHWNVYPQECRKYPLCTNTDGSAANSGPCSCGRSDCEPVDKGGFGLFCYLSSGKCAAAAPCKIEYTSLDPIRRGFVPPNKEPCTCYLGVALLEKDATASRCTGGAHCVGRDHPNVLEGSWSSGCAYEESSLSGMIFKATMSKLIKAGSTEAMFESAVFEKVADVTVQSDAAGELAVVRNQFYFKDLDTNFFSNSPSGAGGRRLSSVRYPMYQFDRCCGSGKDYHGRGDWGAMFVVKDGAALTLRRIRLVGCQGMTYVGKGEIRTRPDEGMCIRPFWGGLIQVRGMRFYTSPASVPAKSVPSRLIIEDSELLHGVAIFGGGAIDIRSGAVATVNRVTFRGNTASRGGAINVRDHESDKVHADAKDAKKNPEWNPSYCDLVQGASTTDIEGATTSPEFPKAAGKLDYFTKTYFDLPRVHYASDACSIPTTVTVTASKFIENAAVDVLQLTANTDDLAANEDFPRSESEQAKRHSGGALFVSTQTVVSIEDVLFQDNAAAKSGAAIRLHDETTTFSCSTSSNVKNERMCGNGFQGEWGVNVIGSKNVFIGNAKHKYAGTSDADVFSGASLYGKEFRFDKCPAGVYAPNDMPQEINENFEGCPVLCAGGTFATSVDGHVASCPSVCPRGSYCPTGSKKPIPCPGGRYGEVERRSRPDDDVCKICPAGYHSVVEDGMDGIDKCKMCQAGQYQQSSNKAFCLTCPAGSAGGNSTHCSKCNAGQFSEGGSHSCTLCKRGRYQSEMGQGACLPCIPGKYQDMKGAKACTPCQKLTFNDKTERNRTCGSCPSGKESKQGSSVCSDCAPGKYKLDDDSCLVCPTGWHTNSSEMRYCIKCGLDGKGERSETGSSSCSRCDAGQYQQSENPGFCVNCPRGYYSDGKGETACKACPQDTYSERENVKAVGDCQQCNDDKTGSPFTTTGGSVGVSNATTGCICAGADQRAADGSDARNGYYKHPGFYTAKSGQQKILCKKCPEGASCYEDGMDLLTISAQVGWWRPNKTSTLFSDCKKGLSGMNAGEVAKERCCPLAAVATATGTNLTNSSDTRVVTICAAGNSASGISDPDTQCLCNDEECYAGALCRVCAAGFVHIGDGCWPCSAEPSLGVGMLGMVIASLPVGVGFFLYFACCKRLRQRDLNDQQAAGGAVETASGMFDQAKIILAHVQILASMPSVLDNVPWPKSFISFTIPFGAFNLDVMSLFSVTQCDLAVKFHHQFVLHMLLPVMLVLVITVGYRVAICVKKNSLIPAERSELKSTWFKVMILCVLLIYPGLATRVFSLLRCVKVDGVEDGLVLAADFSVRCFQGDHFYFAIGGFVCMCTYILGIPLVMFLLLFKNRKHLHDTGSEKQAEVEAFLGGLYTQYEPKYWYFECVIIMHKMLMTGALCVIGQGTSMKPLVAILFQLFFLLVVLKLAPYKEDDDDLSSFVSSLSITLTCLLAFALTTASEEYEGSSIGAGLVAIGIVSLAAEVFVMVRSECRNRREAKLAAKEKSDANKSQTKVQPVTDPLSVNDNARLAWGPPPSLSK